MGSGGQALTQPGRSGPYLIPSCGLLDPWKFSSASALQASASPANSRRTFRIPKLGLAFHSEGAQPVTFQKCFPTASSLLDVFKLVFQKFLVLIFPVIP